MTLTTAERTYYERSTPVYTVTLEDENGDPVLSASLSSLTISVQDISSGTYLNSRQNQNALNANGCTYHATSGLFTLPFVAADNAIVGTVNEGDIEEHALIINWAWSSGAKVGRHRVVLNVIALASVS